MYIQNRNRNNMLQFLKPYVYFFTPKSSSHRSVPVTCTFKTIGFVNIYIKSMPVTVKNSLFLYRSYLSTILYTLIKKGCSEFCTSILVFSIYSRSIHTSTKVV